MTALRVALGVGYPFLLVAGLLFFEARWIALGVLALFVLRAATRWRKPTRRDLQRLLAPALLVGAVLLAAAASNDERALLLVPVAVNAALLISFGWSLVHGPPLIETFARLQVPQLPEDEVRYCRSVTAVWCVFFVANGAVAAWLALGGSRWAWTLYNGFASYLLIGLLFALEFVVRSWRFGRYEGTLVEPLFRRLFRPPPVSGQPDSNVSPGA